jgi:drug/metabolite transporter (DMT)-like permease
MKTRLTLGKDLLVGIIAATLASLAFGVTPALVKIAYAGGSNGVTMTFTRGLFALPVLIGYIISFPCLSCLAACCCFASVLPSAR